MRRREFIRTLGGAAAMPLAARAQQAARPPRMAMLHPAIPPALLTETGGGSAWRAFFGELRRLGYVEGQSLIIERFWAEGRHDRYADVAREIVTGKPDVIVTGTNPVVTVFKAATGTIPIVAFMLDPLQAGLVTNLHRPGGNLTGITLDAGIEMPTEMVEAHVDVIEEITHDGMTFGLRGHLASGSLNGARFAAIYEVGSRSGKLVLRRGQADLEP